MPFLLLAFLITLKRFNILGGHLKNKRKLSHDFYISDGKITLFLSEETRMRGIDISKPVYKKSFYFQRHFIIYLEHACLIDHQSQLWI